MNKLGLWGIATGLCFCNPLFADVIPFSCSGVDPSDGGRVELETMKTTTPNEVILHMVKYLVVSSDVGKAGSVKIYDSCEHNSGMAAGGWPHIIRSSSGDLAKPDLKVTAYEFAGGTQGAWSNETLTVEVSSDNCVTSDGKPGRCGRLTRQINSIENANPSGSKITIGIACQSIPELRPTCPGFLRMYPPRS